MKSYAFQTMIQPVKGVDRNFTGTESFAETL